MSQADLILLNPQSRSGSALEHLIISSDLENYFFMFLLNCKSRRLSERTVGDYTLKIGEFIKFCVSKGLSEPEKIKDVHIDLFLLSKQKTCQAVSIAGYYRCIKRFFRWLIKKKILTLNPMDCMDTPIVPEKVIIPFSKSDIAKLLKQCDFAHYRIEKTRNKAIILLLLDTGIRLGELTKITLEDIDEDNETIKIMGKGARERLVPISPQVMESICLYLIVRKKLYPDLRDHHLWINKLGKPMKLTAFQEMIHDLGERAGVTGVRCSPHTFRHTFGTMFMINASDGDDPGRSEGEAQTLLGHKTRAMTRHYTATARAIIALKAHKKYSPLQSMKLD